MNPASKRPRRSVPAGRRRESVSSSTGTGMPESFGFPWLDLNQAAHALPEAIPAYSAEQSAESKVDNAAILAAVNAGFQKVNAGLEKLSSLFEMSIAATNQHNSLLLQLLNKDRVGASSSSTVPAKTSAGFESTIDKCIISVMKEWIHYNVAEYALGDFLQASKTCYEDLKGLSQDEDSFRESLSAWGLSESFESFKGALNSPLSHQTLTSKECVRWMRDVFKQVKRNLFFRARQALPSLGIGRAPKSKDLSSVEWEEWRAAFRERLPIEKLYRPRASGIWTVLEPHFKSALTLKRAALLEDAEMEALLIFGLVLLLNPSEMADDQQKKMLAGIHLHVVADRRQAERLVSPSPLAFEQEDE